MPISITNGIVDEQWILQYDSKEVILEVKRPGCPHGLSISNIHGISTIDAWSVFFKILNELVWFYGIKVHDLNGGSGTCCANVNFMPSDDSYAISLDNFNQQVFDKNQHLALGFFREAVSNNNTYYEFICYAKILEIPFKDGNSKGQWIDGEIPNLENELAKTFRDRKVHLLNGKTLGEWLRDDGRNALSHANINSNQTVRDPNSYTDWDEIKWGNTVMRELAKRAIKKLGVG